MQSERERAVIRRITETFGQVIDLKKTPGVMIEILRDFGPNIIKTLDEDDGGGGSGGGPGVSSIAIAGPGSGSVTREDLMRVMLELRKETIDLRQEVKAISARIGHAR
jgi:hypothetical protein